MSYFPCDIPFMSVDELIENDINTPKDVSSTNIENTGFISIREALDAVEESRRLNHHKDAKETCAHEYEHRHFLKILMDIQPADVVQVVHAHWIQTSAEDENGNAYYYCSNCGRGESHNPIVEVPYCWKCGAKMDAQGEE